MKTGSQLKLTWATYVPTPLLSVRLIWIPDCDTDGSGCQLLKASLIVMLNEVTNPAVAANKNSITVLGDSCNLTILCDRPLTI